jgi:hypothetical protein
MLTGDATNADPVCDLSPHTSSDHRRDREGQKPETPMTVHPIVFRDDKNSRKLGEKKGRRAAPVT